MTEAAAGDLLAAALYYAQRGWHVIPLHDIESGTCSCHKKQACKTPGKHPRISDWTNVATIDTGTIGGWWAHWKTANVGIVTGRRSNLVVLDIDPRHGGDEAIAKLVGEHEALPPTATVETGGGGLHHYFQCPAGDETVRSITLAQGLELKADGTFVVAPPSRTGEPPT